MSKRVRESLFTKIVQLNTIRMLQRIRNALGYSPGFLRTSAATIDPTHLLRDDIGQMRRQPLLTSFGQAFAAQLGSLETDFRTINATWNLTDATTEPPQALVARLAATSKEAFRLTTSGEDGAGTLFNDVLQQAGLNVRLWREKKSIAEVEKLGSYWRISKSLVHIYREIQKSCSQTSIELDIVALTPYKPVKSTISLNISPKRSRVDCYVHAEMQLLCYYANAKSVASHRRPRTMGASKLSCFLCFLCISCHGGMRPPLPHGQVFDQWTLPDLASFDDEAVVMLQRTIALMTSTILRLSSKTHRQIRFPLTSRVQLTEVPVSSVEGSILSSVTTTMLHSEPPLSEPLLDLTSTEHAPGQVQVPPSHSKVRTMNVTNIVRSWSLPLNPIVELLLEAEESCTGHARLEHITSPDCRAQSVRTVDISDLRPGQDYVISREANEPQLVVDFRLAGNPEVHRLSLGWRRSSEKDLD